MDHHHDHRVPPAPPEPAGATSPPPLSPAAVALLVPGATPEQSAVRINDQGRHADAINLIAELLLPAEGIKWGLQCLKETQAEQPRGGAAPSDAGSVEALKAVSAWLAEPNDANRRNAFTAAESAGLGTPAGCLALAVFLSGGSLAPPDVAAVAPPPGASARALAGALLMAAVAFDPQAAPARLRRYCATGLKLVQRDVPAAAPARHPQKSSMKQERS